MALKTVVETTVKQELKIAPALKKKLMTKLRIYAELSSQGKAIEAAKAKERNEINDLRDQVGEKSFAIEGFKVSLVEPTSSRLDVKKLLAQGVTQAQIEMATVTSPGKPYVKVTAPDEKDE